MNRIPEPGNVTAIIVTRGNVPLEPVLKSLPERWEKIVWDNSSIQTVAPPYTLVPNTLCVGPRASGAVDASVHGRYLAIQYASNELIYVQDDDVIVSDPMAIALEYDRLAHWKWLAGNPKPSPMVGYDHLVVANMPLEFRHEGYTDSCLVGFGSCFHRSMPDSAFSRFLPSLLGHGLNIEESIKALTQDLPEKVAWFRRTCDVVFTTLTPRILVDVPKVDREFASDDDRMWKQTTHYGERVRMLELARLVRDA